MTTRFGRRVRTALAIAPLALATLLVNPTSAQAATAAWNTCYQRDTGSTLCLWNNNPPESWPAGFAPAADAYRGHCWNAGNGFMPPDNVTSYITNHSTFPFVVYDGKNCTGAHIDVWPISEGGMPAGWNDRVSSVRQGGTIEAIAPAAAS